MELLLGVLLVGGLLLLPIRADGTHCCSCCGTKDARHERQIKRLAWRRLKTCSRADRPLRRWHALRREIELVRAFRKVHRARVREAREDRETSDSTTMCEDDTDVEVPFDGTSPRGPRVRHRLRGICLLGRGSGR